MGSEDERSFAHELADVRRELKTIRELASRAIFAQTEAEKEIPEFMRRFANYYHDIVHIKEAYVSLGLRSPDHIDREMERCDDRMRQLLQGLHSEGNAFEKIRREMAEDPENRWDHTRQLAPPKDSK